MLANQQTQITTDLRFMVRQDLAEVLAIEGESFEFAWNEDDFINHLRKINCIGRVAEYDGQIVGYAVYELHRKYLHISNLAVNPLWRRRGVGSQLIQMLIDKLLARQREAILLEVRETNLDAQLFLKAVGFKATMVLHNFYPDTDEDAYRMKFTRTPQGNGVLLPSDPIPSCEAA